MFASLVYFKITLTSIATCFLGLMDQKIRDNADNGITTITDRSHVSSIVYSTIAKGNPASWRNIYNEAVGNRVPDIIVHLTLALGEQMTRAAGGLRVDAIERYDNAGAAFHKKVNDGFVSVLAEPKYSPITINVAVDSYDEKDLAIHVANLIKVRRYRDFILSDKGIYDEKCLTVAPTKTE